MTDQRTQLADSILDARFRCDFDTLARAARPYTSDLGFHFSDLAIDVCTASTLEEGDVAHIIVHEFGTDYASVPATTQAVFATRGRKKALLRLQRENGQLRVTLEREY